MRLGRVLLAGLAGGLAATVAKTLCEKVSPPRPPDTPSPLKNALNAASRLVGAPAPDDGWQEPTVHYLFGTMTGAVYAGLQHGVPAVAAGRGAVFGIAFWLVAHEIGLPWMGLSPTPADMPAREQGNELVSHIVYGMVLESVRASLDQR